MPICWRSRNQIEPAATFTAFLIAVLAGAKRFAPVNWLRGDRALHAYPSREPFNYPQLLVVRLVPSI
jgi:hypothetical protein